VIFPLRRYGYLVIVVVIVICYYFVIVIVIVNHTALSTV